MTHDTFQTPGPDGGSPPSKAKPGCIAVTLIGIIAVVTTLVIGGQADDLLKGDDDCAVTVSLETCKAPSASTSAGDSDSSDGSSGPGDGSSSAGTDEPMTSADLPANGVGPIGGTYRAPDPEDIPEGATLYTGTSGDQLGCITCDGQSRFLSIKHPGVVVGNEGMTSQAVTWPESGQILEFGANLSGPNKGRYGFNVFSGPTTYLNGCSMEIGEVSCLQAREAPHVEKGMPLVIIIGEGGTMVNGKPASKGDFTVDWWFVFQPD
jgi:hypothetical protein